MQKSFLGFCARGSLLIACIIFSLLPFALYIHEFQKKYEPRTSIFHNGNIGAYPFILMGDSVFCSNLVSDDRDAIWARFESYTGKKCFPGALTSAEDGDLSAIARYIANKATAGSTVFIDLSLTRVALDKRSEKSNYGRQITDLSLEQKFPSYKYFHYLDLSYLDYVPRSLRSYKVDRAISECYNRVWNVDGDYARIRYNLLVKKLMASSTENMDIVREIYGIFESKKINAVFVLTPLNKKEIFVYSDKIQADLIYSKLNGVHDRTKSYLDSMKVPYIDLYAAVPEDDFGDLMHTNARGDEIIARALAKYALTGKA